MKFFENRELVVSTLSPVHIGCGEDYEPTNYVIDDKGVVGVLHALDAAAFSRDGTESLRNDLMKALGEEDAVGQLRAVHAALQRHRGLLAPAAVTRVRLCNGVLAHYRQTQDARNDFNRNGIERTAYDLVSQLPYLPGSSLKGAIRTAWLCAQGAGRSPVPRALTAQIDAFNRMIEEVELANGKTSWKLRASVSKKNYEQARKDIEKQLKSAAERMEPEWLGGDFQSDPLRALKIGDAHPCDADIEREVRFCLNRSRSGRRSQAQSRNLYTRLEYIGEQQPAAFGLTITLQHLEQIAGRTDHEGKPLAPQRERLIEWPKLVQACNDYYLPRLDHDLRLIRALKPDSAWLAHMSELLAAGLRDEIRAGETVLLRVGKHGGADSNTADGRQIKIMLNEDRRMNNGREEKIRLYMFDSAPRTNWYCGDNLDSPADLMPHGWIVLSNPERAWQTRMPGHSRRIQRLHRAEEASRRRAEEAEEARQAAEQAAASAAALAAMTPNQRLIEEFKSSCAARAEQLMGNKENANAVLHNKARELAKAAHEGADWTIAEKSAAADAIEEWLPKLVKIDLKDERKKLKLAALRSGCAAAKP